MPILLILLLVLFAVKAHFPLAPQGKAPPSSSQGRP